MSALLLEINEGALRSNWRALNKQSGGKCAAVVKANGYGLGVDIVAPALWKEGARAFFVATPNEARELMALLPEAVVYDLSGLSAFDDTKAIPIVNTIEQYQAVIENGERQYALQFDIGMTRLGFDAASLPMLGDAKPVLVMAQLSSADEAENPLNGIERRRFETIRAFFPEARASLANTGGVLLGDDYHFDLCRPGIGIYGGAPFYDAAPVAQITLPVLQIREVRAGTPIGYNGSLVTKSRMRIATLLGGYADGILRSLSNRASLFHEGIPCPIVGRISMDAIMVDITRLESTPEALKLLDPQQDINQLSKIAKTIPYELFTRLGSRYKRQII